MVPTRSVRCGVLVGALSLMLSCATAPSRPEPAPRVKNSAAERAAAQRAAAPHSLTLEQDEQRWGIEAARERRRQQDDARARQQQRAASTDKQVDVAP